MLTLTRKSGEKIFTVIPPSTEWRVVEVVTKEIRGGTARLGVEASLDVKIWRGELYEKMDDDQRRGLKDPPAAALPAQ